MSRIHLQLSVRQKQLATLSDRFKREEDRRVFLTLMGDADAYVSRATEYRLKAWQLYYQSTGLEPKPKRRRPPVTKEVIADDWSDLI